MDLKLKGKRASVSGSTAGIGFAVALGFAREGAEVVVNGRTDPKVSEAVKRIAGGTAATVSGLAADLGSAAGVDRLLSKLGKVDILVNNIGIFEPKPFLEIPDADWLRFFETNVMSGVRLSRSLLPHMIEEGWGRVIFVSSESGLNIPTEMVHYGMTKTAQLAISRRGIAESVAGTGVTVNAVLPGPTRSEGAIEFLEKIAKERGIDAKEAEIEAIRTLRPTSLLKRMAKPEEVANLVVYLCGEPASATTGSALRVDGGVVRTIT
jgi:NAD(P)-dependent dehydrogenase (short-subunit alcohol dehydrogenase family)